LEYSANEKSDRIFKSAKLILNHTIIIMATALKFTIATKKLLQQVVKNTLVGTLEEYYNIQNQELFTEEALRYITVNQINRAKIFGQFPNKRNSNTKLCFEFSYKRAKSNQSKKYKPDIAIIDLNDENEITPLIAIELKIQGKHQDIYKCHHYVSEMGIHSFEIAVCIIVCPFKKKLPENLAQSIHRKRKTPELKSNILVGTIEWNHVDKDNYEPEIITYWINR
jgi:hypothetical protein